MIRKPAVANQFYDGDPLRLHHEVGRLIRRITGPRPALMVVSPHAGYMYSGHVAGAVFRMIDVPETCVILGPNHTGLGEPAAVMTSGSWAMPMGTIPIEESLAAELIKESGYLADDANAHVYEHSIEVQLPFLQYRQPDLKIVPICLSVLSYQICKEIGLAIARAIVRFSKPVLLVASTDMSHYEPRDSAESKDKEALKYILNLDPEGLYNTVRARGISMCGVIPTAAALTAAISLGASKASLVKYTTSGDITGDYRNVVGYAGCVIE
ncbi:MAG: AmmeMemoRadiSam system protein B [Dissulfurimicrobium sp.]|uniref:AmmeMemoRadiSam system protein B n=1 Tax=Dissulfurimicrobium TaxID=1769732 RepID=UPI001EDB7935|nr:AmmeMemoRadiSam system protein B [Dissulfurimicrobium hydrothermale]UKL13441.1 AmmeMemoRadiSam system protein B [Dissulfurimicrobium hydrothermale]